MGCKRVFSTAGRMWLGLGREGLALRIVHLDSLTIDIEYAGTNAIWSDASIENNYSILNFKTYQRGITSISKRIILRHMRVVLNL